MATDRSSNPVDEAMRVMRDLRAERDTTVVVGGRGVDRFIARLIDAGMLVVALYILTGIAARAGLIREGDPGPDASDDKPLALVAWSPTALPWVAFMALFVFVAIFVLYELISHRVLGATPGKRRTQLAIVDSVSRAPASTPRLTLRTLVWAIPLSFGLVTAFDSLLYSWGSFGVVFAMYLWSRREDARGRPFWDVVAGTRVVTTDPPLP
jgi:hypothetical protein